MRQQVETCLKLHNNGEPVYCTTHRTAEGWITGLPERLGCRSTQAWPAWLDSLTVRWLRHPVRGRCGAVRPAWSCAPARDEGPRLWGLARAVTPVLPVVLQRSYAWLAARPPARAANCLKGKEALQSTDTCSAVPVPQGVWAGGPANYAWRRCDRAERTQLICPAMISPGLLQRHDYQDAPIASNLLLLLLFIYYLLLSRAGYLLISN